MFARKYVSSMLRSVLTKVGRKEEDLLDNVVGDQLGLSLIEHSDTFKDRLATNEVSS